jgi:hypothetical protein
MRPLYLKKKKPTQRYTLDSVFRIYSWLTACFKAEWIEKIVLKY